MTKKIITLAMALLMTVGFAAQAQEAPNGLHRQAVPGAKTGADTNATIAPEALRYWVGTGSNQLVFVVNWADTALAWGYRFSTATVSMTTVINDLAAADPRLTFGGTGFLDDIWFVENGDTLKITPGNYWEHTNNGIMSAGMGTTFQNGDFSRWADPAGGVVVDSIYYDGYGWFYTSAYPRAITPVSDPYAPTNATIAPEDITFWVGQGNFDIIFAVNWPDTALAWGYHFSARSTNLQQVMDAIAAADPRVRFVTGSYGIDDILFIENGDTLHKAPYSWWEHTLNGQMSAGLSQQLNAGDFSRWADPTAGVAVDSTYDTAWGGYWIYTYAYPQTIYPVTAPVPQDATIGFDDIRFWVGEGQNRVIFAVNWVDTALAWGFRYDNSATVLDAMNAVAAADSRFSYTTGDYGIDDILFVENGDTLRKATNSWWEHSINGSQSMGAYQSLADGDFSRWADPMAGVLVDSVYNSQYSYWMYIYAYPRRIYPAENPDGPEVGPFCGAVGTEGCTAVKFDDTRILDWARACTIVRGSSNLSDPEAAPVTYGTESEAVGAVDGNNMNVVSLGDGGTATLTFARPIANGEGFDFAVYENSFNDSFLELAFVEVSTDGETFVRFPATSLTQTDVQIGGYGSVDPTFINNLAGKYRVGYGTPFDLEELRDSTGIDINNINYVRLVDVVGSIDPALGTFDAFGHMINDPFPTTGASAGFDLDGVAVLNQNYSGIDAVAARAVRVYPNPADGRVGILASGVNEAELYDMTGRRVAVVALSDGIGEINTAVLPAGIYMLRMGSETLKVAVKH